MRYAKKIGFFFSAIVLSLIFMAADASAQLRIGVNLGRGSYRPHYARRYYPPYQYGYYGKPYWRPRSERYYDRQSLNTAKHRLNNDEDKYYADGYLTPKEQKKLASDQYKLNRDRRRLNNDW